MPDVEAALDALPDAWRSVIAARIERIQASRDLCLIEQPTYKRRWYNPDHDAEEQAALALWLADRAEDQAKNLSGERDQARPFTALDLSRRMQADPAVNAVCTVLHGQRFDLDRIVNDILGNDSVPGCKYHVYKPAGLIKRAAWERTWTQQHAQDAWDAAHPDADDARKKKDRPTADVPPAYKSSDFLRPGYWRQRGKLDVRKERFIAYTEVPPLPDQPGEAQAQYGWAGWTPLQRADALIHLDQEVKDHGAPITARYGLLHGVQFLLPYIE